MLLAASASRGSRRAGPAALPPDCGRPGARRQGVQQQERGQRGNGRVHGETNLDERPMGQKLQPQGRAMVARPVHVIDDGLTALPAWWPFPASDTGTAWSAPPGRAGGAVDDQRGLDIDLPNRRPYGPAGEVHAGERRPRQEIVQARGGAPGPQAIELVRGDHHDRAPAADRHALRPAGRREADNLAESRLGFPELPGGLGGSDLWRWGRIGHLATRRGDELGPTPGRSPSMRPAIVWSRDCRSGFCKRVMPANLQ